MRTRLRISFTLVLMACFSKAQMYFEKKFDYSGQDACQSILQSDDTTYYGVSNSLSTNSRSFIVQKFNANGDTIISKEYLVPYCQFYAARNSLVKTHDGNFIIAQTFIDSGSVNYYSVLLKFDQNCDTIWMKKFGAISFIGGRDCFETKEKEIILTGDIDTIGNAQNDFYLIKTDSLGNLKWMKTYNKLGYDVAVCCRQTLEGGYVMSGSTGVNVLSSSHWIVKTDSSGNLQWDKSYTFGLNDGLCWITQTPDSNYYVAGARDVNGTNTNGVLRKLNKLGDAIWTKQYLFNPMCALITEPIVLANTDVVIGGQIFNTGTKSYGFLLKTDSAGTELWRRSYTNNPAQNHYTYDVRLCSDHGFILSGQSPDNSGDAWILKTDSFGCLIAGCDGVGIEETQNSTANINLTVYPNPGNGVFTISSAYISESLQLEVFDVSGKMVFDKIIHNFAGQTIMDLSALDSGFYILRAIQNNENKIELKLSIQE